MSKEIGKTPSGSQGPSRSPSSEGSSDQTLERVQRAASPTGSSHSHEGKELDAQFIPSPEERIPLLSQKHPRYSTFPKEEISPIFDNWTAHVTYLDPSGKKIFSSEGIMGSSAQAARSQDVWMLTHPHDAVQVYQKGIEDCQKRIDLIEQKINPKYIEGLLQELAETKKSEVDLRFSVNEQTAKIEAAKQHCLEKEKQVSDLSVHDKK